MGAFCCHGNQSFYPICPKSLCSLSPTPVMLHIKSDQDWPAGFRDIQVWKCGRRRTDDGPLVHYKLTLWAFGSGELKKSKRLRHGSSQFLVARFTPSIIHWLFKLPTRKCLFIVSFMYVVCISTIVIVKKLLHVASGMDRYYYATEPWR